MSKLDDLESWLRASGVGDEATPATRSIAAGILAVAGKGPVTAAHVATGIELARDAGISEVATLERVGALLLAFQAGEAPPPVGAASAPLPVVVVAAPPAAPVAPPPELQISIRSSQPTPRVAATTGAVARIVEPPPPVVPARPPTRKGPIVATLAAVAAVAGFGAWWNHARRRRVVRAAAAATGDAVEHPGARAAGRVPGRLARDPRAQGLSPRGARLRAPGVPRHHPAGQPARRDDGRPGARRRRPRRGAGRRRAARVEQRALLLRGCEVAGDNLAVCRGTATLAGEVVTLQTYLRVGPRRAVLAMFMAKPSVAEPAAIAASIVAGFGG